MKTETHQNKVYPQNEEIPAPLEVHPSVSPLAAELLMKTVETLSRSPHLYAQDDPRQSCGSPCCIIGHMALHTGNFVYRIEMREKCGLTPQQYELLFFYNSWPSVCQPEGKGAVELAAAEGIARIEHFLRTGE